MFAASDRLDLVTQFSTESLNMLSYLLRRFAGLFCTVFAELVRASRRLNYSRYKMTGCDEAVGAINRREKTVRVLSEERCDRKEERVGMKSGPLLI